MKRVSLEPDVLQSELSRYLPNVATMKYDFRSVDWGPDEAKGDSNLARYFVEIPEYDGIIAGKYRYIIGRKGTGKTALCERIRLQASQDPLAFAASLSLRNFPLPIVRELREKSLRDKSQFVPVWSFLLATELARLVVENESIAHLEAVRELRHFLQENFPEDSVGFTDTLHVLKKRQAKLSISPKWFGVEGSKEQSVTSDMSLHYQRVTTLILKKLSTIHSDASYFIFMDELDEGYRAGDAGLRLILLALLRATEDTYLHLTEFGFRFRPILVLRSDIFDKLEDNDLNKLDDYLVRLKWYGDSLGDYSLKRIATARIGASFPDESFGDPWDAVTFEHDPRLPLKVKSLWKYILNRTLERPRDVIKFLKLCAEHQPKGRLAFSAVFEAERSFSDWLFKEMRDEIHSHLPVWREALECITRIGHGVLTVDELEREFRAEPTIRNWLDKQGHDIEEIFIALFDFGIIGNLDGTRWLFRYKDEDLTWSRRMKAIVHFGFHKKLRLRGP